MRVPPHSNDAEEALLGALLIAPRVIDVAAERLTSEHFYTTSHGDIFAAIVTLWSNGQPANPVTVTDELRRAGLLEKAGGPAALVEMQASTPSISEASVARYTADIEECYRLRKLIEAGGELVELGYTGRADVAGAIDEAEAKVFALTQDQASDSGATLADLMEPGLNRLEELFERGDEITGLPTGLVDLDELLGGLQPSAFYLIGARPAVGKTSLMLNIAAHAHLETKVPVCVFSLEMSRDEMWGRLVCAEARIDSKRMRTGKLEARDWARVTEAMDRLYSERFHIEDNPRVTLMEMRAKARRLKSKYGELGLIAVDYLQLMTGREKAENRHIEVSEISRGLKILARELECPVVALSQLSRGVELRNDKRPMLADLKESGSLEQDADVVIFAYRDELYNADSEDRGTAELIVAKHRNGATGTVRVAHLAEYTRFANLGRGI